MRSAPLSEPASSTSRAPYQRMSTAMPVPMVSVMGWASTAMRVMRAVPRA